MEAFYQRRRGIPGKFTGSREDGEPRRGIEKFFGLALGCHPERLFHGD
jgi:hypothetical protein